MNFKELKKIYTLKNQPNTIMGTSYYKRIGVCLSLMIIKINKKQKFHVLTNSKFLKESLIMGDFLKRKSKKKFFFTMLSSIVGE